MKSYEFFIKTERKHIDFLNKVFEAYEGLGIVRTIDANTGDIKIITMENSKDDIVDIISDLKDYGIAVDIVSCGEWGGQI
jgi:hypothetical protein